MLLISPTNLSMKTVCPSADQLGFCALWGASSRMSPDPSAFDMAITLKATHLRDMFGDVGILLVVRDKASMMEGLYSYHVQRGRTSPGKAAFFEEFERDFPDWANGERHMNLWARHFTNALSLDYEDLCSAPLAFLEEIAEFIGISSFQGIDLRPTHISLHQPWLGAMHALNCIAGVHPDYVGDPSAPWPRMVINALNGKM